MLLVAGVLGLIWAGGALLRWPFALRWALTLGLWGVLVLLHMTLVDGHPLRQATGGSAALWGILGGAVVLIAGYSVLLRRLRAKAAEVALAAPAPATFSETELERYARHIILREIGGPGQKRLKSARVLVIGAGGLGSPALLYLAAAGVGTIGVIDDDMVENSNLQRQVLHRDADIGTPKVRSATQALLAQNPYVVVRPYQRRLTVEIATELFADYDVVLDGTDNFETRYLVNAAAVSAGIPLISGALGQWEGQISVFDPARGAPCYQCIFPQAPAAGLAPNCSEAGVLGPLPGVVGAMMAAEAIKLVTGAGAALRGEMLIYDALYTDTRKIRLTRREDCPVCGGQGSKGL